MDILHDLSPLVFFFAGYGLVRFIIDTKPKFDKIVDKYLKK